MQLKTGIYKHYKGNLYRVIGLGKHSETLEDVVVYQALYGEHVIWVRPLKMFFDVVDIDGAQIRRFEYMDEMVDVVNEHDEVVGQTTKSDAHEKGLLHRTIIAQVVNADGERLLVKQAGDRQDPGQYVSPVGGHMRAGESEMEALRREAKEEIGAEIDTSMVDYVGKAIFNRFVNNHQENHYFILYEIHLDIEPRLNHESVGFKWFSQDEINETFTKNPAQFGTAFHFVWKTFYTEQV